LFTNRKLVKGLIMIEFVGDLPLTRIQVKYMLETEEGEKQKTTKLR